MFVNPEITSLTTGSYNFPNMVYENSTKQVSNLATVMSKRNIKPQLEIFDTSMIRPALDLYE